MKFNIYETLLADPFIKSKTAGRIKLYEYPAASEVTGPCIVIDPIGPSLPGDYADNQWLSDEHSLQIEVWSKTLSDTESISKRIREVMWDDLGFAQQASGVDEWDRDTGVYREARRYRGKTYVE
ncbi:hypothetical protein ACQCVK_04250 [Rossellomorea vietnamensis]|uniref:hypothetical protein n=1 Tax=Rossellomorea vietnamensis TaxID=218284 RepID=UPI003CFAD0F0